MTAVAWSTCRTVIRGPRSTRSRRSARAPARVASAGDYRDIIYEAAEGIARITINRPERRNAFRPQTLFELADAFERARDDIEVGVIVLTGAGPDAFCSGGDQRIRGDDGYMGDDTVAAAGVGRLNVLDLQVQIRRLPKPVDGPGRGVRHRRRAHLAPRVRPVARGRQRPIRPDRSTGRLL